MAFYSDTHINGKHISEFNYNDWVQYFLSHGATLPLAENFAKNKIKELSNEIISAPRRSS